MQFEVIKVLLFLAAQSTDEIIPVKELNLIAGCGKQFCGEKLQRIAGLQSAFRGSKDRDTVPCWRSHTVAAN